MSQSTSATPRPRSDIHDSDDDDIRGTYLPEDRFADREISWLAFNERVLELASNPDVPLLERVRFLAIFASNLDEFFMVRVAGLKRRIATGIAVTNASGVAPREVLDTIVTRTQELQRRHAAVFQQQITPLLRQADIIMTTWDQLDAEQHQHLQQVFRDHIFPVLTPLALDPAHPFPYISGLSLNLAVTLRNPTSGQEHFARVKVPPLLPRFLPVNHGGSGDASENYGWPIEFIAIEEVIAVHLDQLFPGMQVQQRHTFRVTRNEDLEVEEDDAENLLQAMEKELRRRKFGPPVRLEVGDSMDPTLRSMLIHELGVSDSEVFVVPEPLDLRGLHGVADLDLPELHYRTYIPTTHPDLASTESSSPGDIFAAMAQRDILLHHPYDAFSTSVQAFIEQAAADPQVLAIKQTLYRTSGDSPIVDALVEAAQAGKQVLALVEIKARFDEQANISWARTLEQAGVHVVYGMVGLKTHAKLALVVRHEPTGLRRYCHIGTGNYNPKTARLYEDFGLLTCDEQVGEDLTRLFNQLSGYAPKASYRRLLVAPRSLRSGLVDLIDREIDNHRKGLASGIRFKMNSIVDETLIDALYRASQAGVPVSLVVRGICGLRPQVPQLSENISVVSVLGRYLEHSRVFWFTNNHEPEVYLGSADLMHRNLDRRVEALIRITDPRLVAELDEVLTLALDVNTTAWHLNGEGQWVLRRSESERHRRDLQEYLIEQQPVRRRRNRRRYS